jgi:quinol-cytochrome oxidoreductase complex cytochrome b subunit
VWQITLLHILIMGMVGICLFCILIYCIGLYEGNHIKLRKKQILNNRYNLRRKIVKFYILILFLLIILSFLFIKISVRGAQ